MHSKSYRFVSIGPRNILNANIARRHPQTNTRMRLHRRKNVINLSVNMMPFNDFPAHAAHAGVPVCVSYQWL